MNKLRLTGLLLTRLLGLWLVCTSCVQVGYAQQSGGGNYPTGNGVRVREVDGSPNVPGTQTLVFPNGSLTRAGQTVTVTIGAGITVGTTTVTSGTSGRVLYNNAGVVGEANVFISANTVEQRNSTTAQTFNVYNTYTSSTNNELLAIDWATSANIANIWTKKGSGGGTARALGLGTDGTQRWNIGATTGHLLATVDNTYDIGAATATRPRDGNFARDVYAGNSVNVRTGPANAAGFFITSPSDGVARITNWAATDFSRLQFGGTSASFGAIGRDGAGIKIVGGDGTSVSWIKVPPVTVAALPAAATAGAGARSFVTDALTPVFGSTVTGGGAVAVPVYSDGTNWIVG